MGGCELPKHAGLPQLSAAEGSPCDTPGPTPAANRRRARPRAERPRHGRAIAKPLRAWRAARHVAARSKHGEVEASSAMELSHLSKYYAGYAEGDQIINGNFDVIVCDGFSGNIMLKTAEGTAKLCSEYLKQIFNSSILGKISFAIGRSSFIGLRKKLDPRKHNGAVLLGLNGIVVKSHGGADSISFAHAVDLATEMSVGNYNDLIKKELNNLKPMHRF